jgi:hypothetical protein
MRSIACFVVLAAVACRSPKPTLEVEPAQAVPPTSPSPSPAAQFATNGRMEFRVALREQTVKMEGLLDRDFCLSDAIRMTGAIINGLSTPFYISADSPSNVRVSYLKRNGVAITPSTVSTEILHESYMIPSELFAMNSEGALQLVRPGEHVQLYFNLCPVDAKTKLQTVFPYAGPGDYEFQITYEYTGRDFPVFHRDDRKALAPTFHGTLTSNVLRFHAD